MVVVSPCLSFLDYNRLHVWILQVIYPAWRKWCTFASFWLCRNIGDSALDARWCHLQCIKQLMLTLFMYRRKLTIRPMELTLSIFLQSSLFSSLFKGKGVTPCDIIIFFFFFNLQVVC